jgi:hypothetical protein
LPYEEDGMALKRFWTSICSAARFLVPSVIADAPKFDGSDIEAGLRHTRDWLTPASVEGFDEHDLGFLPDDICRRLAQCVNEFRAIAQRVASDEQATDEQLEAALPSLMGVLEVMRPDRYADLDALIIGKRVERELADRLPDWVREIRFETGNDSNGDPAVWVDVDDEAATADVLSRNTRQVRGLLGECVRHLEVPHWPYVRFRTSSERAEATLEAVRCPSRVPCWRKPTSPVARSSRTKPCFRPPERLLPPSPSMPGTAIRPQDVSSRLCCFAKSPANGRRIASGVGSLAARRSSNHALGSIVAVTGCSHVRS